MLEGSNLTTESQKLSSLGRCEQPQYGVPEPDASEHEQVLPEGQLLFEQLHLESRLLFVALQSLNAGAVEPIIRRAANRSRASCMVISSVRYGAKDNLNGGDRQVDADAHRRSWHSPLQCQLEALHGNSKWRCWRRTTSIKNVLPPCQRSAEVVGRHDPCLLRGRTFPRKSVGISDLPPTYRLDRCSGDCSGANRARMPTAPGKSALLNRLSLDFPRCWTCGPSPSRPPIVRLASLGSGSLSGIRHTVVVMKGIVDGPVRSGGVAL